MNLKSSDLVSLFEKALHGLPEEKLEEIGIVIQVGDGICKVYGLSNVVFGETVYFQGGNHGIVFQINEDSVDIFLLNSVIPVTEREVAKRSGTVFSIPVSMHMLGRVVNVEGKALD